MQFGWSIGKGSCTQCGEINDWRPADDDCKEREGVEVYDVGRGKIMKSLNVINKILKWTLSV